MMNSPPTATAAISGQPESRFIVKGVRSDAPFPDRSSSCAKRDSSAAIF